VLMVAVSVAGCGLWWPQGVDPAFTTLETVFTLLFTLEMLIKMIGFGLVDSEHGYFRDAWNWLDFVIVVEGLMELFASDGLGANLSAIRSVRALRPLRSITRLPGGKGGRDGAHVVVACLVCVCVCVCAC